MRLSEVQIFKCYKRFFPVVKISERYFKIIFTQKQKMYKMPFFDQNHGLAPLENMQIATICGAYF